LSRAVRLGVVGATGALGVEVLALLDASRLRVAGLLPIATQRSLGEAVSFQGEVFPVQTQANPRGLDLLLCCAPPQAALDWVREALRSEVPCIDCSGALALSQDVPLRIAALDRSGIADAPLLATPTGLPLVLAHVLAPILRAAGLTRIGVTVLESSSAGGREGIAALGAESVALFNQQDPEESEALGRSVAFDCHPAIGEVGEGGSTPVEAQLPRVLGRLLGIEVPVAATVAQIPVFVGQASALAVETEVALDPKRARELLAAAPGVSLWTQDAEGPNLRAAAGQSDVLVGRLRADPTRERGLLLWLAADPLRLAAANAVALAELRLGVG
jgi:aspartate-semialdehyde dehydrogenase